jgi:hypothetical protein
MAARHTLRGPEFWGRSHARSFLQLQWERLASVGVTAHLSVGAAKVPESSKGTRMFRHWPKAAIAIGLLLTLAWTVFLAWLVVHDVLAAI